MNVEVGKTEVRFSNVECRIEHFAFPHSAFRISTGVGFGIGIGIEYFQNRFNVQDVWAQD